MAYINVLVASVFVNLIGIAISVESMKWKSLSACTTEGVSTTEIDCKADIIQIGHSHYGVKSSMNPGKLSCNANFNDCIMDYTTKLSERCNGLNRCSMSLLKQFIHKCKEPASYLQISYRCVKVPMHSNICKSTEYRTKQAHILSPMFPRDYPKNVDCTCIINRPDNTVLITEAINFHVMPPDIVNIQSNESKAPKSILSSNATLIVQHQGSAVFRFKSDSSLSRSGFWIKLSAYPSCPSEWEPIGDKCIRLIKHKLPWNYANQQCHSIGGHLLTIRENSRKQRIQQMLKNEGIDSSESIWIGLRYLDKTLRWMDGTNEIWNDDAIWPWDQSKIPSDKHACTSQYQHRWQMDDCLDTKYFVCEQDLSRVKQEILMTCGPSLNLEKVAAYAVKMSSTANNPAFPTNSNTMISDTKIPILVEDFHQQHAFHNDESRMSFLKPFQNNESFRLSLVLTFMVLVLIALIISNVLLIYLCQRRLKKTLQSSSNYAFNLQDPKSVFDCFRRKSRKKFRKPYPFDTLSPLNAPSCYTRNDRCYTSHRRCCKHKMLSEFRSQTIVDTDQIINHFYEPVIQNVSDSGYSTVPKRCCLLCRASLSSPAGSLYQSNRQHRFFPNVNNASANTIDDVFFNNKGFGVTSNP